MTGALRRYLQFYTYVQYVFICTRTVHVRCTADGSEA